MTDPLKIEFDVGCSAEHAFAVWTAKVSMWWPADHTVSGEPDEVVIQPLVGGRIYERTAEGLELDWGEVTLWDPPRRLGYLWHIGRDRVSATEVTIDFVHRGDHAARVEIEHRGLGDHQMRDANRSGWSGLIPHFVEAANS